jgi:uncharacterized membrane protein YpjA
MRKLLWLLIAANLVGAAYGFFFFYGGTLWQTFFERPWLLPFVPDCPLFSLVAALAFIALYLKEKSPGLNFLALAGALKYGFWTVFVLLLYGGFYFQQNPFLYSLLFWAHVGLFFEAFLLAGKSTRKLNVVLPVLGFLLLSDLADYVWQTHPPLPAEGVGFMFGASVLMTLGFSGAAWLLAGKEK